MWPWLVAALAGAGGVVWALVERLARVRREARVEALELELAAHAVKLLVATNNAAADDASHVDEVTRLRRTSLAQAAELERAHEALAKVTRVLAAVDPHAAALVERDAWRELSLPDSTGGAEVGGGPAGVRPAAGAEGHATGPGH